MLGLCHGLSVKAHAKRARYKAWSFKDVRNCVAMYSRFVPYSRDIAPEGGISFEYYKEIDRCPLRMSK